MVPNLKFRFRFTAMICLTVSLQMWGGQTLDAEQIVESFFGRPIPLNNAYGDKQDRETFNELRQRLTLADYRKYTEDPKNIQNVVEAFIVEYNSNDVETPLVGKLLKKAENTGSKDPLFLSMKAYFSYKDGKYSDFIKIYHRAYKGLSSKPYWAFWKHKLDMWRKYKTKDSLERHRSTLKMFDSLAGMTAQLEGQSLQTKRWFLQCMNGVMEKEKDKYTAAAIRAVLNVKHADLWVKNTFVGGQLIDLAWRHRGSAGASRVTQNGWREFYKYLDMAEVHLTEAWELHPELPHPAAKMIIVAKAYSEVTDSARIWFDRSVAAQMDYNTAYYLLVDAMRPKWGGNIKTMAYFALECFATKRYDTDIPWYGFWIFMEIQKNHDQYGQNVVIWKNQFYYKHTRNFLESIVAHRVRTKNQAGQDYYRMRLAALHFCNNEKKLAAQQMKLIQKKEYKNLEIFKLNSKEFMKLGK